MGFARLRESRCRKNTRAELRQDMARLRVVADQIKEIEDASSPFLF